MRCLYLSPLVALALCACSANDDVPAPAIASVSPARAMSGTSIAISGSAFCQQPPGDEGGEQDPLACEHVGVVQFGASSVAPVQYTDTAVTAVIPDLPPGPIALRISVAGRVSNAFSLTIE
jgi:IPT/TIG domain